MSCKIIDTDVDDVKMVVNEESEIIGAIQRNTFYKVMDIYKSPKLHDLYHRVEKQLKGAKKYK